MSRVGHATLGVSTPGCRHRDPGDDFYCLRYGVWYPSIDCAFRTRHKTSPGCVNCEQGRFNLKRHGAVPDHLPIARHAVD